MDYDLGVHDDIGADAERKESKYKLPPEELDTDFKRKYPPDAALGTEMDDHARVWKVYRGEATEHDTTMLDGWNKTLDILLIFAGLFSAVATAFVVESYQLLQPDHDAYVANALYILVSATQNASQIRLPVPPNLEEKPSTLVRWINGLWFTSVLLSLAVALLCILVKQWLTEYVARNAASIQSPRHWARRRQIYFQALHAWPVAGLISVLPVILHLALFLFFLGAILFLWTLDTAICRWIISAGVPFVSLYIVTTFAPLWVPDSPTSTPLAQQLYAAVATVAFACLSGLYTMLERTGFWIHHYRRSYNIMRRLASILFTLRRSVYKTRDRFEPQLLGQPRLWKSLQGQWDTLESDILRWLITSASESDAIAVAFQAFGAIPPETVLAEIVRHSRSFTPSDEGTLTRTSLPRSALEICRTARTFLLRDIKITKKAVFGNDVAAMLASTDHPDAALISRILTSKYCDLSIRKEDEVIRQNRTPSLTSTALLLVVMPISITPHLFLLWFCDWSDMPPERIKYITKDLLESHGQYPPPSMRPLGPPLSPRASLIEAIACNLNEETTDLGIRVLADLLDVTRVDLGDIPCLMHYLSSPDCNYELCNDDTSLERIFSHFSYEIVEEHLPAFVRICRRALSAIAISDTGKQEIVLVQCALVSGLPPVIRWYRPTADHIRAYLKAFLLHSDADTVSLPDADVTSGNDLAGITGLDTVGSTLWHIITTRCITLPLWWFAFMESVIYQLHVISTDPTAREDAQNLATAFFSSYRPDTVLTQWSHEFTTDRVTEPERISRYAKVVHNVIAIQASWWIEALAFAQRADGDSTVRSFVLQLQDEVAKTGHSTSCPGGGYHPRVRPYSLDQSRLSQCSFEEVF